MRAAAPIEREPGIRIHRAGVLAYIDGLTAAVAILGVRLVTNLHSPVDVGRLSTLLSTQLSIVDLLVVVAAATAWPILFHLFGLYSTRNIQEFEAEVQRLAAATAAGTALAVVLSLASPSRLSLVDGPRYWLTAFALGLLVRGGWRVFYRAERRQLRRALIVGTGQLAQHVCQSLRTDPRRRYEVVGFVDDQSFAERLGSGIVDPQAVATLDQLEPTLMRQVIDEVFIALPIRSCYEQMQYAISVCERAGVQASYQVDLFERAVASVRYHDRGDRVFVAMRVAPDDYRLIIKRVMDILGAAGALILFAPLMLLIGVAIKLTSRGPVVYTQDRCGLHKRPFRMYKFRSMFANADGLQAHLEPRNEASGPVFKIRHDPRITPLGRFLRRTSLDELPQLWNVLTGDMSLVGPRPLPWRDVDRITTPSAMRRVSVRPGLTCLWQVSGRNNLDFERWVALDLEYIDNWSLALDAKVLMKTIPAVLSGEGAT